MTQSLKTVLPYIGTISTFSLPCGTNVPLYFAGDVATCGASDQTPEKTPVDLVDFGPPELYQQHVINS